jgi:hypothetical protein
MTISVRPSAVVRLLLTAVGVLAVLPSVATAAPTIETLNVKALPVPGVPGTGRPGTGAVIRGETRIAGTEYDGSPAPLTGIAFYTPPGVTLNPQGFSTCSLSALEQLGPPGCPKGSAAGPVGFALGTVSFGGERVPERASVQGFFAAGGGFYVYVDGVTPALIEIIVSGHASPAVAPFGPRVIGEIPLIATVPEAPYASFLEGAVEFGATRRQDGRTIPYLTLPERCPRGGWKIKVLLSFLGGTTVEQSSRMPCPR